MPATGGDVPPESSFTLAELNGNVYVGTGYGFAGVYRWLGGGAWRRAFTVPMPHNLMNDLASHGGQLFTGSSIYQELVGCATATPVYTSSDGSTFAPSPGFPGCYSIFSFASSATRLIALGYDSSLINHVHEWNPDTQSWSFVADYPLASLAWRILPHGSAWYTEGTLSGTTNEAIYRATDLASWEHVADVPETHVLKMLVDHDVLYVAGTLKLYALDLCGD